jgi:actin-related protein 2
LMWCLSRPSSHISKVSPLPLPPYLQQFVKCGYAGENFPRTVFPSLVGRPMLRAEESSVDTEIELKVRTP